jgi:hypothetical protein
MTHRHWIDTSRAFLLGSSSNSGFAFGTVEVYSLATLFGADGGQLPRATIY